ncbi:MAG TPA: chromate transporter [Xanthobacteraceae bacterium]|nr:chromate transporter [Xanthobacteraceae bacterium]
MRRSKVTGGGGSVILPSDARLLFAADRLMDARTEDSSSIAATDRASIGEALRIWTQVSVAGIGGPALQIATMHRLLVEGKRWITEQRFYHALSYCIALPGPETQQLAVYVGWLAHRTIGGVIAGALFIVPGALCMMVLSVAYVTGGSSQIGQAVFIGVKPAILAVMIQAIIRFGQSVLLSKLMLAVAALAFAAAFVKIPFPIIVLGAALIGAAAELADLPSTMRELAADAKAQKARARPTAIRTAGTLALWLALWLTPLIALAALFGTHNIYTQIAFVFGKVAVMAVGGDGAVLSYATQQAVDAHHWVSAADMQAGIAMGEMVPGTIMIVSQFLGFITAYRDPGTLPPLLAGGLGGLLATWMTFTPCFLFIMVTAPFIDGLRSSALLNSTLHSVTAAAVGMLANLAAWFGIRTMFHHIHQVDYAGLAFDLPDVTSYDLWALALFIAAALAVLRFKLSPAVTLVTFSIVGIVLTAMGVAR